MPENGVSRTGHHAGGKKSAGRAALGKHLQTVVKFRLKAMEDDTTGDDHYDRTETLYYNPKDKEWRFSSSTGDAIRSGGSFIVNRGGGATAEVTLTWDIPEQP